MMRARVLGLGAAMPANRVSNHDLPASLETSDDWIRERTGITQRYIASPGELTSDLAARAGLEAIKKAGIQLDQVDLVILATATPDDTMPATAVSAQRKMGMVHGCPAFDLHAACSGFIYGISVAEAGIRAGVYRHVLVIGAETFSRVVDWKDRGTCVLFGDGAGAAVLGAIPGTAGVLATRLHADGRYRDILMTNGGLSSTQSTGFLQMQGKEVFRHAVAKMCDALHEVLEAAQMTIDQVNWFVPHQANRRILEAIAEKLAMPPERFIMTLDQHANTSAASIPLALYAAVADGRIKAGDKVALQSIGAGLTWASCLIEW